MTLFKQRVGKVIFAQTTGGLCVIIPYIYIFYIYICYLTLKTSQHHYFIYLIFKPNFTTTNVFLLYFCCVLQSTLVLFIAIRSTLVLFSPLWFYLVHFGPIQSTLVLFDPIWSIRSYSVHFVHFGPFSPFSLIRSTLVQLGLIWPT